MKKDEWAKGVGGGGENQKHKAKVHEMVQAEWGILVPIDAKGSIQQVSKRKSSSVVEHLHCAVSVQSVSHVVLAFLQ